MIWVGGKVVADDALTIDARDRTFEHGLGLFETLRTYRGRASLLGRHLARLRSSAKALRIPLDPASLPDHGAVAALVEADGARDDVLLRITLTGGINEVEGSTLWMRTGPLPPPMRHDGALVAVGSWWIVRDDPLARYKALNYWSRRRAYESARALGYDETISTSGGGVLLWEGSRTNLFVIAGGRLVTPPLDGPIVPGIMRGLVIEQARRFALTVETREEVVQEQLTTADEVFLTNSVRGIIPVARLGDRAWPAPGPWTQQLSICVNGWLFAEGGTTA